jgi:1-deoxy-D-xylulose-5-phosphate reductoisomerase
MTRPRKQLILLGSTGSIGRSTLDVVRRHPDRFRIVALAAHRNVVLLLHQAQTFQPEAVAVGDPDAAEVVRRRVRAWKKPPQVFAGGEGVLRAAAWPRGDLAVSALVGTVGLLPTLAAIRAGKDVALANKETLVMAGDLVMREVRRRRVRLLPVDSEHAALAQCLQGRPARTVKRLILTASGGPFANFSAARLRRVTAAEALRHPTWSMGQKITVDSATLMNKGLEVIEAHHLFQVPYDRIAVVVHPQSIVHALVEFTDGSALAQLAVPDMRLPIATALSFPETLPAIIKPLDLAAGLTLAFGAPDTRRFPCLDLALRAGRQGGTAPAALNAANEIAVQAFLDGGLKFTGIPKLIARVLARQRERGPFSLARILEQDAWARSAAKEELACQS